MIEPDVEVVECDVLVVGGGMSGCGAAFEAAYWAKAKGLRVVVVEKAAIERSGAVAMGLSAINCYMGMRWGENQPEDFVHYVRNDLMGLSREDLVYDIARHVDSSVHMFEEWGLPIFKTEEGRYKRSPPPTARRSPALDTGASSTSAQAPASGGPPTRTSRPTRCSWRGARSSSSWTRATI